MGPLATGQVVLLNFPFSDLSRSKLRPVLLVARAGPSDWIAAQITSNAMADPHAVELTAEDFSEGGLQRTSYLRPAKLFTAHESLFRSWAGTLQRNALVRVRHSILAAIQTD